MTATDDVASAFKSALAGLAADAYDAYDVPKNLPNEWVEVGLTRTFGGNDRLCGVSAVSLHYVTFGVGGKSVSNVRKTQDEVRAALEGVSVAVGDTATTPLRFYAEDSVEFFKDLGRFWQLATYSYAI